MKSYYINIDSIKLSKEGNKLMENISVDRFTGVKFVHRTK